MLTNRIGLAGLALMVSVPFLLPWHTTPIPSFYSEWWAVAFGLTGSLAMLGARRFPLTGFALLTVVLAAIAMLQSVSGHAALMELASFYSLYLAWAALVASASSYLVAELGLARVTRILATAILTGALLAAVFSLLQPWSQFGFSIRQGGPLGQANHLTSYLWLGLSSLLYLRMTNALSQQSFWTAAVLLIFTVVLVGQRSSFLYAFVLIMVAFWMVRQEQDARRREVHRLAMGIMLLFLAMQPVAMLMPTLGVGDNPPPAMRAAQQIGGPSIRLQLWRVGWEGIAAAPLLGNGIGAYPGLALTHSEAIAPDVNSGPAESAHNIFIDLAVEFGLPVALMVLMAAAYWLWRVRKTASAEGGWALAIFCILGLHALIEYPLSYAYFLGLLAVVAGAYGAVRQVGQRLASVALSLGLVLWGCLAMAELRRDYRSLESALAVGRQAAGLPAAKAALLGIPAYSLLSPWVSTTACISLDPLQVEVADGLAVCRIALRFAPTVECGVNQAVLLFRQGDVDGALMLARSLRRATHYNPRGVDSLLHRLAMRDERLGMLAASSDTQ